jgi:hypothetical protein
LIIHYHHRPNTGMHMVVVAALLAMLSPGARGNDQRVFIEQALDQPTSLTLKDTTLPRAVQQIANQTGIGVTLGPATLALLPYGEATQVDIDLRNSRLRDGLDELCRQIGMTYRVTDTGIEIIPAPPLARLGRPASWEELTTITRLLQTRWSGDDDDFKTIRKRVRFDGINGKADDLRERLEEQIERAGPGPAAGVLDRACARMDGVWIPWADEIVVMSQPRYLRHRLQRTVALRYYGQPLAEVLRGLSRQAGIPIRMDPASAAVLPERIKSNISLVAEGVSVEEALEQLVITTGMAYALEDGAIVLRKVGGGPAVAKPEDAPRRRDPIVGKIVIHSPDGQHTYEWFIRESDLTPEERQRVERLKRRAVEAMRRDLP